MRRKFLKRLIIAALSAGTFCMLPSLNHFASAQLMDIPSDFIATNIRNGIYNLKFDSSIGTTHSKNCNGQIVDYIAYENIVYVAKPVNAEYQSMNIYIPKGYSEGKTINGYTSKTAPIFLPNGVGGYMPGKALTPMEKDMMTGGPNAVLYALSRGYVVACPAIRGRTTVTNGKYVGKAPAFIVDYKAAVRYLRFNRENLPAGDVEKIISNGTSAGGALSALLGVTGDAAEYEPYLKEIGAAKTNDDIFASSVYCPITNLDHADMAYEWIFYGVNEYHQGKKNIPPDGNNVIRNRPDNAPIESKTASTMTTDEIDISKHLKNDFDEYVNSLDLRDANDRVLTLDDKGNGSFKDYIKSKYIESAQSALDAGTDLSDVTWITVKNGRVVDADLDRYPFAVTRMKAAPAFDKLDLSSAENDEFGTSSNTPRHFSMTSKAHETKYGEMVDNNTIKLMNPMNFIGGNVNTASHFRIRHGAIDRDTSLAIPAILALKLSNRSVDVDFFVPWNRGHAGDYDLEELFDWTDEICKAEPHHL